MLYRAHRALNWREEWCHNISCCVKSCAWCAVARVAAQLEGSRASSGAAASTSAASQATAEHTGQASYTTCISDLVQ